jgi:virulence-associated protein VagC
MAKKLFSCGNSHPEKLRTGVNEVETIKQDDELVPRPELNLGAVFELFSEIPKEFVSEARDRKPP